MKHRFRKRHDDTQEVDATQLLNDAIAAPVADDVRNTPRFDNLGKAYAQPLRPVKQAPLTPAYSMEEK